MLSIQPSYIRPINQNRQKTSLKSGNAFTSSTAMQMQAGSLKQVSFGTVSKMGEFNFAIDTNFFRKLDDMLFASAFTATRHPEGAVVVHIGDSTGEESIVSRMLLKSPIYRLIALENDRIAVRMREKGIHSVLDTHEEGFIFKDDSELSDIQKYLKRNFYEYFEKCEAPRRVLNDSWIFKRMRKENRLAEAAHFKINGAAKALVEYRPRKESDILKFDLFEPGLQIHTAYCRNMFYHLTQNRMVLMEYGFLPKRKVDLEVLDEAAQKLHSRLKGDDNNRIVVLGDYIGEHMYIAPPNLPDSETIRLVDTSWYDEDIMSKFQDVRFYKKSPLQQALEKDGMFKPIKWGPIDRIPKIEVPLVYKINT